MSSALFEVNPDAAAGDGAGDCVSPRHARAAEPQRGEELAWTTGAYPPSSGRKVSLAETTRGSRSARVPTSPAHRSGVRRRSRTEIFNDVVHSEQERRRSTLLHENQLSVDELGDAVAALCGGIASAAVANAICFPSLASLMRCDADSHALVNRHEQQARRNRPAKAQVEEFVNTNNRVLLADIVQSILAVISTALYVYETYETHHENRGDGCDFKMFTPIEINQSLVPLYFCDPVSSFGHTDTLLWLVIVEACFAAIYSVDYLVRLYISPNRLKYIFSIFAIADVITIVPVILTWAGVGIGTSFGFIRVVRLLRLLRVLKAVRLIKGSHGDWTAIKQANVLFCTVFSLVFVAAGLIHWAEEEQGLTFGDSLYFIIVTMSTVGFGDTFPQTAFGKSVIAVFIVISLIVIPVQTGYLVDLLNEKPKEMFKTIPGGEDGFVILAGHHLTHDDVYMFIKEFYHPAHKKIGASQEDFGEYANPPGVVVVSKEPLSVQLNVLLRSQSYKMRMRYVVGSLLEEDTLRKLQAYRAKACFVFATGKEVKTSAFSGSSRDKEGLDMVTSLQTLNFRSFTSYQIQTYCLLNHSAGRTAANAASADYIVSLDETRLKLMAQSCICPGLSTLVINFITSYREHTAKGRSRLRSAASTGRESEEYKRGMSQTVFEMGVPKQLVGSSFIEAAVAVYMKFQIALLGVIQPTGAAGAPAAAAGGAAGGAAGAGSPSHSPIGHHGSFSGARRHFRAGREGRGTPPDSPRGGHGDSGFGVFSKAQATDSKIGSLYRKIPEFNFVLNPGHRYRLKESDVLAVIAVDLATCEVCNTYDAFPIRPRPAGANNGPTSPPPPHPLCASSGGPAPSRHGGHGVASLASAGSMLMHRRTRSVSLSWQERARRRLKGIVWAIVSLQKLLPMKASLPERTVLDVNAAVIKHRHYYARQRKEAGRAGGRSLTAQPSEDLLDVPGGLAESVGSLTDTQATQGGDAFGKPSGFDADDTATALRSLVSQVQEMRMHERELGGRVRRLTNFLGMPDRQDGIRDWVREGVFKDHIIVTGGQRNLAQFMRALKRSLCATKTRLKTVLYLAPHPPVGEVWNRVSHFRHFYYCQGDPKISNDLYRAGIEDASSLVILSPDHEVLDGEADAEAVFIVMAAMNLCPADPALMQSRLRGEVDEALRAKIASGILKNRKGVPVLKRGTNRPLFIIAELSSTVSVKYFNDVDVLQAARSFGLTPKETAHLRASTHHRADAHGEPSRNVQAAVDDDERIEAFTSSHQLSSFYSSGFLISNQMLGPILPHAYYSHSLIRIVEQFMQGSLNQYGAFLGSIPVPAQYVGRTYGELYYNLAVNQEMLPLGLYRAPRDTLPLPYVFTNPPKTAVVGEHDMVYVLQSGADMDSMDSDSDGGSDTDSEGASKMSASMLPQSEGLPTGAVGGAKLDPAGSDNGHAQATDTACLSDTVIDVEKFRDPPQRRRMSRSSTRGTEPIEAAVPDGVFSE